MMSPVRLGSHKMQECRVQGTHLQVTTSPQRCALCLVSGQLLNMICKGWLVFLVLSTWNLIQFDTILRGHWTISTPAMTSCHRKRDKAGAVASSLLPVMCHQGRPWLGHLQGWILSPAQGWILCRLCHQGADISCCDLGRVAAQWETAAPSHHGAPRCCCQAASWNQEKLSRQRLHMVTSTLPQFRLQYLSLLPQPSLCT